MRQSIRDMSVSLAGDFRGSPVGGSECLTRILGLPRREPPRCPRCLAEREAARRHFEAGGEPRLVRCAHCYDSGVDSSLAKKWTALLRKEGVTSCDCEERFPLGCLLELRPVQGWLLEELHVHSAVSGLVGTGHGKTGMAILAPMVALQAGEKALVLLQSNLREQFLRDHAQWSVHFKVPNLAGAREVVGGRPIIYVVTYPELSGQRATTLLPRLAPKLIIADEAHNLASADSARGARFRRLFEQRPGTAFLPLSGTLTKKALEDYAHLLHLSLGEGSPLPIWPPTVQEWGAALDAGDTRAPAGALNRLCGPGEDVREGFRRRLVETPGVIATEEGAIGCSLVLNEHELAVPRIVTDLVRQVEEQWVRPDGEELVDAMRKAEVVRQLASGFFYRWRWPESVDKDLKDRWLEARKQYNKELREKLKVPVEHLDSEGLLFKAAARWHRGYTFVHPETQEVRTVAPHTRHGPLAVWASDTWEAWVSVAEEFERRTGLSQPPSVEVWVDDFLVQSCAEWARKNKGIVWYDWRCFGPAVAKAAGVPCYGGGEAASVGILNERGKRAVVASIDAHGTGKNLQSFSSCLVAQPPSDGGTWEQMLARTHRPGQKADVVEVDVVQHLASERAAMRKAYQRALYIYKTTGNPQKLLVATRTFPLDTGDEE